MTLTVEPLTWFTPVTEQVLVSEFACVVGDVVELVVEAAAVVVFAWVAVVRVLVTVDVTVFVEPHAVRAIAVSTAADTAIVERMWLGPPREIAVFAGSNLRPLAASVVR